MDSLIAIIIVASPILFYLYEMFPDVKVLETSFFTYTSLYYESVSTLVWVFLQKFIFLYLMIIWFFTSKDWWNKSILAPIGMLLYQIIVLFNDDIYLKDIMFIDKFYIITTVIAILVFLVLMRNKLKFFIDALDLKAQIENEIYELENEEEC